MVKIEHLTQEVIDKKTGKTTKKIQFESGKNIKARLIKRNYLNKNEHNELFTLLSVVKLIEGEAGYSTVPGKAMWDSWQEKGMMTKDQAKNLKLANTYLSKFVSSIINDNLDVAEKSNLISKSRKFDFRLIDDYTLVKIQNMLNSVTGRYVEGDLLDEFVCNTMDEKCKGCAIEDRSTCTFRTFLEDNFIPPFSEMGAEKVPGNNCEYSYK